MEFSVYAVVIMFLFIFGNQEELPVLSWNSGGTKQCNHTYWETHTVPWHLVKISYFVTSIIIFSGTTCKLDKILNKNWKLLKYNSTRRMENRMYALIYQFNLGNNVGAGRWILFTGTCLVTCTCIVHDLMSCKWSSLTTYIY